MTRCVPPHGPLSAPVCFVGEAPGEQEEAEGRPFCGPSGKLLRGICVSTGVPQADAYWTNVIKERPPRSVKKNNDVSGFITFNGKRVKTTPAYDAYEQELWAELQHFEGNLIVAVGKVALWALLRETDLYSLRGSILEGFGPLKGRKILPIYHPAAALHSDSEEGSGPKGLTGAVLKTLIAFDMQKAAKEMRHPEIRRPARSLAVLTGAEALKWFEDFTQKAADGPPVSWDIETFNHEVISSAYAQSPSEAVCIPLQADSRPCFTLAQELKYWELNAALLESAVPKIAHNSAYEHVVHYQRYGINCNNVEDTMIAHKILWPDFPMGLGFCASLWTNEPFYKDEGDLAIKKDALFGTDLRYWEYNAKDAAMCAEIWPQLQAQLEKQRNWDTYVSHRDLVPILTFMQTHGMRLDADAVTKVAQEVEAEIQEKEATLASAMGLLHLPPKFVKSAPMKRRAFDWWGAPTLHNKSGKATLDKKALVRLSRCKPEHLQGRWRAERAKAISQIASAYIEVNELHSFRSKGLKSLTADPDGRLRCSFNPVGAATGRLPSSTSWTGTGGNLQNIPKRFGAYIKPDAKHLMYMIDLAGAEDRIVAYCGEVRRKIEAFELGLDGHRITAGAVYGVPPEQISEADYSCGYPADPRSQRDIGKAANHGLNYQLGPKNFALANVLPESEGKRIHFAYHRLYPEVIYGYGGLIKRMLLKDCSVLNLFGRRRIFRGDIRPGQSYVDIKTLQKALSHFAQSTVADIVNRRGLHFIWERPEQFAALSLLNQVHDSVVFQIPLSLPLEQHVEMLWAIKESMEQPLVSPKGKEFVVPVDLTAGPSFSKKTQTKLGKTMDETLKVLGGLTEKEAA